MTDTMTDIQQRLRPRIRQILKQEGYLHNDRLLSIRTLSDAFLIRGIGPRYGQELLDALSSVGGSIATTPGSTPDQFEQEVYRTYLQYGTYHQVATKLSVSIHHVHKILAKGTRRGWWTFIKPTERRSQTISDSLPQELLESTYKEHITTQAVADALHLPITTIQQLARSYNTSHKDLTLMARRFHTANEVALILRSHRDVTIRDLRQHGEHRKLYQRILYLWNTIDTFLIWCEQHEIKLGARTVRVASDRPHTTETDQASIRSI